MFRRIALTILCVSPWTNAEVKPYILFLDTITDLTLPAVGIPLVFARTYNGQGGWTHNYAQKIEPAGADPHGIPWTFTPDATGWAPPPKLFQHIETMTGGYKMTFKDGLVYEFETAGSTARLSAQRDLNGNEVLLSYDAQGRLAAVAAASGNSFTFGYPTATRWTVTDSALRSVAFDTDGAGRILTETDVLNQTRTYSYDSAGRMRTKTDFRGNEWKLDYDDHDRIVRVEDPIGGVRTWAYDFKGKRTLVTDRDGHPTLIEVNNLGQPVRTVDALGNERVTTWVDGLKTAEQDARGNVTEFEYFPDGKGNLKKRTDPSTAFTDYTYGDYSRLLTTKAYHLGVPITTTNTYTPEGNLETTTDANDKVTTYTYLPDDSGLVETITRPGPVPSVTEFTYWTDGSVKAITDPEQGVTQMVYDAAGHIDSIEDPDGNTRDLSIDAKGQLQSMTDALLRTTSFGYDADGNRFSITAPGNVMTTFTYDALSRLTSTTDALGKVTRQEYDAEGTVTTRIDARGFRTTMSYDAIGRLVETCDPLGHCTTMSYCAELSQQPCATVDALGNVTTVEEDEMGRETARVDALGNRTETQYDDLGRRETVEDPAGKVTTFGYDELNRLTSVLDALNGETIYGHDDRGNRTSVRDANIHTTSFEYDRANRLTQETTPILTTTEFTYYAGGQRKTKKDGKGQFTRFDYDANQQLQKVWYDFVDGPTPTAESTAEFDYDEHGSKIYEAGIDSTRTMTYDDLGRLESVDDQESGRTIVYTYDRAGNRAAMSVNEPSGDETTTYAWDARGLLLRMTDPENGEYRFGYDALGRRTSAAYPNGMTLRTSYDAASRVVAMIYRNAAGGVIQSFTYTYDSRGNRTAKVFADGTAELYGYDDLSRLTRATYPSGRQVKYVYDPVGNRTVMTEGMTGGGTNDCAQDQDCDGELDASDNCPLIANPGQQDSDSNVGLVSAWQFEEAAGDAVDLTGKNPAQLVGGVTRVAEGKFGSAVELNGTSAYLALPTQPVGDLFHGAFTLTFFARSTGSEDAPAYGFLGSGTNNAMNPVAHYDATNGLSFGDGVGYQTAQKLATAPTASWRHYAVVDNGGKNDGGRYKVYEDGTLKTDVDITVDPASGTNRTFVLGQSGFSAPYATHFAGRLDEVTLWSRALTASEIQDLMAAPLERLGDACDPCPTSADPTCAPTTCRDDDGDGYGVQGASACPGGVDQFDCDDSDPARHPAVAEACDSVDNDCDGRTDEACLLDPVDTTYVYNDFNQLDYLTRQGVVTDFAYDANGNQTDKAETGGITTFVYDARDRMTEVLFPNSSTNTFGYDTQNLRVYMNDSQGERRILLDGIEEYGEYDATDPTLPKTARYDHDPSRIDALLAQTTSQGKHYFVTDALGSVYGLVDAPGSQSQGYSYDVYGARTATPEPGQVATDWGFTSRSHRLNAVGLLYSRQRFLDLPTGAWLAADAAQAGANWYSYVLANPTTYVDPHGLAAALVLYGVENYVKDKDKVVHRISTPAQLQSVADAMPQAVAAYTQGTDTTIVSMIKNYEDAKGKILEHAKKGIAYVIYLGHIRSCGSGERCLEPTPGPKGRITVSQMAELLTLLREVTDVKILGCDPGGGGAFGTDLESKVTQNVWAPTGTVLATYNFAGGLVTSISLSVPGFHKVFPPGLF